MREVLFIQGGGAGAYDADAKLAESLRKSLGPDYLVRYPEMPDENEPEYEAWSERIAREVEDMPEQPIVVAHSLGGSVFIKWLVGRKKPRALGPVFLVAAPFWYDDSFWSWKEVELPKDAGDRLPPDLALFIYHGADDDFVPPAHAERYARLLPRATLRLLPGRDHQLNDDLGDIAGEIRRQATAR